MRQMWTTAFGAKNDGVWRQMWRRCLAPNADDGVWRQKRRRSAPNVAAMFGAKCGRRRLAPKTTAYGAKCGGGVWRQMWTTAFGAKRLHLAPNTAASLALKHKYKTPILLFHYYRPHLHLTFPLPAQVGIHEAFGVAVLDQSPYWSTTSSSCGVLTAVRRRGECRVPNCLFVAPRRQTKTADYGLSRMRH